MLQRNVHHRGIENFHESSEHHRNGDDPRVDFAREPVGHRDGCAAGTHFSLMLDTSFLDYELWARNSCQSKIETGNRGVLICYWYIRLAPRTCLAAVDGLDLRLWQ